VYVLIGHFNEERLFQWGSSHQPYGFISEEVGREGGVVLDDWRRRRRRRREGGEDIGEWGSSFSSFMILILTIPPLSA